MCNQVRQRCLIRITHKVTLGDTRTFIVKAINAIDAGTLVIAPQQEEVLRILDFVRQQQADRLQRLFAAIDVITEEQVIALRRKSIQTCIKTITAWRNE